MFHFPLSESFKMCLSEHIKHMWRLLHFSAVVWFEVLREMIKIAQILNSWVNSLMGGGTSSKQLRV